MYFLFYKESQNRGTSKNPLRNKINELLGLCKEENQGINTEFQQVVGAERQILTLMKQEFEQPPRFNGVPNQNINNYARSNVQMFPGTQPGQSYYLPGPGPNYNSQNYDEQPRSNQRISAPLNRKQEDEQDYGQQNYGYSSGHTPQDRTNFLKSKVLELQEQNSRLKGYQNQNQPQNQNQYSQNYIGGRPEDDPEIRHLQQEIARLRSIVQGYENELAALSNSPVNADKASLLRQLKDQGERIRQDTLALLRGKIANGGYTQQQQPVYSSTKNYQSQSQNYQPQNNYQNYNNYQHGYSQGNPGFAPELISSGHRGINGLSPEQQAQFRAQLNELRQECAQLQQENANIKRTSKGTNHTSGSRRY